MKKPKHIEKLYALIFLYLGSAFIFMGLLCFNDLLIDGTKINGTVEKVYLQKYTHYGKISPFRVYYTYTHKGKNFHHKSYLLWDKPKFHKGDSIIVYANDFGKSTIQLWIWQ